MLKRTALSATDIDARLRDLAGWTYTGGQLHRELQFRDFSEAFGFMARVALEAEKLNHHPDWRNVWSKVVLDLSTHDAGGVTESDFELARRVEALLTR